MALHVRTDYYWIKPPRELQDKTFDLAYIAALAKKLNAGVYIVRATTANEVINQKVIIR